MARGKVLNKYITYPNVIITSNILDATSIKSCYLFVSSYFDLDEEDIIKLKKKITKTIKNNLNKDLFYTDRIIDVEEIRTCGDWNYVGYEFTLFFLKENMIEVKDLEKELKRLMDIIYDTHFDKPEFEMK